MKKPYKTNGKRGLLEPKIEKVVQNDWKSIIYRAFSRHVSKTSKNLIKPMENVVFKNAKTHVRKPYKTCRLWRHLEALSEVDVKKYPKGIRFSTKSSSSFPLLQNIGKPLVKQCFEACGIVDKITYKACRLWRLLEPFADNGIGKHPKSITFIDKN